MLPKEHGAYGQIAFPLLTALLVAGVSKGGLLIAVAVVAGFMAHEPATVLLGLRGPRAKRQLRRRASRWLRSAAVIGVVAGVGGLLTMHPAARWSLAVPMVPALLLATATVRGQEKSWHGETAAALACSGAAMPVSLAACASLQTAASVAIPFALLFVASTLAVRFVILRVRDGGKSGAARNTRRAALAFVGGASAILGGAAGTGLIPGSALIAAAPGLLTAAVLAVHPPQPSRLRIVGWILMAVSVITAMLVVATA
jgi:hypothetical protein